MQEKVFKLQSLFGNVFVHKYIKTKVPDEQLIAKDKIKLSDDL